jgi:hypothetical protein
MLFIYILIPLRTPVTLSERRYNRCHIKTRNFVERTIGILKRRFGCLANKLRYDPQMACNIIVACCVLHNLAILHNEPLTFEPDPQAFEPIEYIANNGPGNAYRRGLIDIFFND